MIPRTTITGLFLTAMLLGNAQAQFSGSFTTGSNTYRSSFGMSNSFGSSTFMYSNPGTYGLPSNASAFPDMRGCGTSVGYGEYNGPHGYGLHNGTHVGPSTDALGYRNYGLHTGQHVDYVNGSTATPVVGTPWVGRRVVGTPVVPVAVYGSPGHVHSGSCGCNPPPVYYGPGNYYYNGGNYNGGNYYYNGGYNGISVTYSGFPVTASVNYSNYSTRGTTQVYVPGSIATAPYGNITSRGTSAADYLPNLNYERVQPRTPAPQPETRTIAPPSSTTLAPSTFTPVPSPPPAIVRSGKIERGDMTVEFVNVGRAVELSWSGNPSEVRAVTFMTKDALRVPNLLRRVSSAPYKVRFDLPASTRYLSVEVEYRDGVVTTHQLPLGG